MSDKRTKVFLDYDQAELDRQYDQRAWAPNAIEVINRYTADSEAVRRRLGDPRNPSLWRGPRRDPGPISRAPAARSDPRFHPWRGLAHVGQARQRLRGGDLRARRRAFRGARLRALAGRDARRDGRAGQIGDRLDLSQRGSAGRRSQTHLCFRSLVGRAPGRGRDCDRLAGAVRPAAGCRGGRAVHQRDLRSGAGPPQRPQRLCAARRRHGRHAQPHPACRTTSPAPSWSAQASTRATSSSARRATLPACIDRRGGPVRLVEGGACNHFEVVNTLASPFGMLGRLALQQMGLGLG